MLRAISRSYPFLPRLVPDGIFEERTEQAVVLFQQNFGLPPTGTVDNDTWDAVASVYRGVVARTRLPRSADVYPSPSVDVYKRQILTWVRPEEQGSRVSTQMSRVR